MVIGVDGCKAGWVAIALGDNGRFAGAATAASLGKIFAMFPGFSAAGVDMPLCLLHQKQRPADHEARAMLGATRGRSVFPAPPAFVIEDEWINASLAEVNAESRKRHGMGVPAQSLALRPKIREVNDALAAGHPVIEVHPELSFAAMEGNDPIILPKKTFGGITRRLARLENVGIRLAIPEDSAVNALPTDDVLDAAAAAWSAWRFVNGKAGRVPSGPSADSAAVIWF